MTNKLQQLVIDYKTTKHQKLLEEIFLLLDKLLIKKAKYIFYKQKFFKNYCVKRIYDEETKQYIDKQFTECFKLCDIGKVDYEDVLQELKIEVLRIIENYDIKKPFMTYLVSSIWKWRPDYIRNKQFVAELSNVEENENILDKSFIEKSSEEINTKQILKRFSNLTEQEEKYIKLKINHPEYNQSEIADILGVTQQRVSELKKNLRKKYSADL